MRQEDKEVDGFELEQAEERRRETDLIEDDEEELYDLDGKPEFERDRDRTTVIAGAMREILEGEHVLLDNLELTQRELRALEAIKTAASGRDQSINGFVFAEDRRTLLEQALAVLQPDLANLEAMGGEAFEVLVKDVAQLREHLKTLEDAQEEIEPHKQRADKGEAGDADDKPKPPEDDQSLTGPERKLEPKPPSSLTTGPEVKQAPKPPSSLTGPELNEQPKPPTSLGDPEEIAEQTKKPWWRRLTGG